MDAEIFARERETYQYNLQAPAPLFQQALREDPGLYGLAVACSGDKNLQLLATPFPGEVGIVARAILEEGLGNVQLSRKPPTPTGRRLVVE